MKLIYNSEKMEIRSRLAVIPLRDVVVFPHMIYPLLVGRSFTVKALQEAMVQDKQVLLVAQHSAAIDSPKADDLYEHGVVARVLQVMKMPNGTLKVLVEGMVRASLKSVSAEGEFITAKVALISRKDERHDRETEALSRAVVEQFTEYVRLNRRIPDEVLRTVLPIEDFDRSDEREADPVLQSGVVVGEMHDGPTTVHLVAQCGRLAYLDQPLLE